MFAITPALLVACVAPAFTQSLNSSKRGLCYVATSDSSQDDSIWDDSGSDLNWYYNYAASPTSEFVNSKLQFVPMLWGTPSSNTDMTFYDTVKGLIDSGTNISFVLGFNEPDECSNGGSCCDAQTAAATWIREIEPLREMGVKLGAPAVTGAPSGFSWLQSFFTYCDGNCTADFIPVHWYGNFEGLASHVGQVNATYENMTMWVTEFAYNDVDLEESQQFYNQSTQWFDTLSYLTHYSYFGAFRSDQSNIGPNAAMLTQKGELTDIGAWYLGQKATGNVPKGDSTQISAFSGWVVIVMATMFYIFE